MKRNPTQVPDSLKYINVKALLRKRGIFEKQADYNELKAKAVPIAKKMIAQKKSKKKIVPIVSDEQVYRGYTNEQVNEYWEKQIHMVDVVEKKFEEKLNQYIQKVAKGFLTQLDQVITQKSFVELVKKDYFSDNEDDLLVAAQLDFAPLLDNIAVLAGNEANKLIGLKDPYLTFNYKKQIAKNIEKFTKSMLDTDREKLINTVTNGLQDGLSVPEIRSQILNDFEGEYTKNQAQRITRTEVLRASNQATLDAFEQSGVVEGKQWVTYGATDECAQYDGQIVTLGKGFYSGGNEFQDGDPPLHPNCRCVIIPIIEEQKTYQPDNSALLDKIADLESKIDKRTKDFRELKKHKADDEVYIKSLEKYLGVDDESLAEAPDA